jgi:hypothetical protein
MALPTNPYRPGAGTYPPYLAGREAVTSRIEELATILEEGGQASALVLPGVRGMGKTSLLLHAQGLLAERGWIVPDLQEMASNRRLPVIWDEIRSFLQGTVAADRVPHLKKWESGPIEWGAGVEVGASGPKARGDLKGSLKKARDGGISAVQADIVKVFEALGENGVRLALLFDETQAGQQKELKVLIQLAHRAAQRRWSLMMIFGGLPPTNDRLVRAASYASHFETMRVGPLEDLAAREALRQPAIDVGVAFTNEGLKLAVGFAQGIPYHIQVIGQQAWRQGKTKVGAPEVSAAIPVANETIEASMYEPLWNRASDAEQGYLVEMARHHRRGYGSPVAKVLGALKMDHPAGAQVRARLMAKGLVHAGRYGYVEFSYPGFDIYAKEQARRRR